MPVKDKEYHWHDRVHGNRKCDTSVIWVKEGPDPFHTLFRAPFLSAQQKLKLFLNMTTHDSQAECSLVHILKITWSTGSCTRCSPPLFLKEEANILEPNLPPLTNLFWWSNLSSVSQAAQPVLILQNAAAGKQETEAGRGRTLHSERRLFMHLLLWHKTSNLQTHELFMQVVYASATELKVSSGPSRIYELKCSICTAVLLLQSTMIEKSLWQSIPGLINHDGLELAPLGSPQSHRNPDFLRIY